MVKCIGLRVESNTSIHYSIIEVNENEININYDQIIIPNYLDVSEYLPIIRILIKDIIMEFNIDQAYVKRIEYSGQGSMKLSQYNRLLIEGVLIESIGFSGVKKSNSLLKNQIYSLLKIESKDYYDYINALDTNNKLIIRKTKVAQIESIIVALAGYNS